MQPLVVNAKGTGAVPVTSLRLVAFPLLLTALLGVVASPQLRYLHAFMTYVMLQVAWGSWVYWKAQPEKARFPVFTLVACTGWHTACHF